MISTQIEHMASLEGISSNLARLIEGAIKLKYISPHAAVFLR